MELPDIVGAEPAGSDEFGQLFTGRWPGSGQPVRARLFFRRLTQAERERLAAFQALGDCPGLSRIVAVGETASGLSYWVTEDHRVRTLAARQAAGERLGPGDCALLLAQVCETLAVLDSLGLAHGAIGPECLGFDGQRWWLAYPGVAAVLRPLPPAPGTPMDAVLARLAPEVLAGADPAPAADVYALAATVVEAVTGTHAVPPEGGERVEAFLDRLLAAGGPAGLPASLTGPLSAALDHVPARRPGPAALRQLVEELVPADRPPAPAGPEPAAVPEAADEPEEGDGSGPAAATEASGLPGADELLGAAAGVPAAGDRLQNPLDDDVQLTVYRPGAVPPATWQNLLVYAHKSEPFVDPAAGPIDPVAMMREQVQARLGADFASYQSLTMDNPSTGLAKGSEIEFVPVVEGVEFNPRRRSFLWYEPVHGEEFRFRADPALDGRMAAGSITVVCNALTIATIPLKFRVQRGGLATPLEAVAARPYHKIFASYSHLDADVVDAVERSVESLGNRFLRDVRDLRSGEIWNDRLMELIREADIFQLFWSTNSMLSPYVRQEYRYALSLNRPNFVRPTYWEQPMPRRDPDLPPPELSRLHFFALREAGEPDRPSQHGGSLPALASLTYIARAPAGTPAPPAAPAGALPPPRPAPPPALMAPGVAGSPAPGATGLPAPARKRSRLSVLAGAALALVILVGGGAVITAAITNQPFVSGAASKPNPTGSPPRHVFEPQGLTVGAGPPVGAISALLPAWLAASCQALTDQNKRPDFQSDPGEVCTDPQAGGVDAFFYAVSQASAHAEATSIASGQDLPVVSSCAPSANSDFTGEVVLAGDELLLCFIDNAVVHVEWTDSASGLYSSIQAPGDTEANRQAAYQFWQAVSG